MIRTEAIPASGPCYNRKKIGAPLAISLWLTPVFRPFATQTPYTAVANHVPINAYNVGADEHESHSVFEILFNNRTDIDPYIHSTDHPWR
jgi:hypothetical protein